MRFLSIFLSILIKFCSISSVGMKRVDFIQCFSTVTEMIIYIYTYSTLSVKPIYYPELYLTELNCYMFSYINGFVLVIYLEILELSFERD